MWIGAKRNSTENPFNLKWPSTPIKGLGIYLTYDETLFKIYNYNYLVPAIAKIINIWKQRNLTVYGKVIVAKTFLISKINFVARIISLPIDIITSIERMIFKFVWKWGTAYSTLGDQDQCPKIVLD